VTDEFMRFMAAWALVHESADEGWKAAVERGSGASPDEMAEGADAFVDGLAAAIAEEKERLKAALAEGGVEPAGDRAELLSKMDDLSFEVGEMRGRLESLQASIDALGDDGDGVADDSDE
jgi:hypothetical protein